YVFMTDFVGWLPMDEPGSREAYVAADYNEENIRHIERYPYVRDGAVFVGFKDDVVPRHFGPELPSMPDWIERHFEFACCDLAVVQGGLTTTMELVANRRPFVYIPLQNHFEQNHHVVYRLRRYGAPAPTFYDEATPERLAAQMLERLGAPVDYAPVEADGAARAARLIAPLLEERKGRRRTT